MSTEKSFDDVVFSTPSMADKEDIWEWLCENFYPDEPMSRSLGLNQGNGFIDRQLDNLAKNDMVNTVLTKPHPVMAKDKDGKIVGMLPSIILH